MKLEIRTLKIILPLCLFLANSFIIISKVSYSKSPESKFELANKFFLERNFEKAISLYEELVKSGNKSAEVYYNLGNAYYKTGNYAAAILNYERAKKLKPSDEDINFNLRLANLNTIDKIEAAPQVFYVKWWNDFVNSTSLESHSLKALFFFWFAFVVVSIYVLVNKRLVKKITLIAALIIFLLGAFSLYFSYKQFSELNNNKAAIIFSQGVYIKSSPDENSINLFMLHSGTKVEVIDELQDWKRIRIANGNEGWLPASSIELI